VLGSLSEAARGALEALMNRGTYEYQSEFARKYVAQGREEGERAALFEVFDARGLKVEEGERHRIQACTDLSQLKRWLRRAVSVQATHELFEPEPAAKP
jgi:hypothetical protein